MTRARRGRQRSGGRRGRGAAAGPAALVTAAVLVAGVRLVDTLLPSDPASPRPADDPAEILTRVSRVAALTLVVALGGWAGRSAAGLLTGSRRTSPRA